MKLKCVKKSALMLALSASFILPQIPKSVLAQDRPARLPLDLFPIDTAEDDTGLFPPDPTIPGNNNGNANGNSGGTGIRPPGIGNNGGKQQPSGKVSMFPAKVPQAFSCTLFDNRPNGEIFSAIDALAKEIKPLQSAKCDGIPADLDKDAAAIKNSITALQDLIQTQDPSTLAPGQIDTAVNTAIAAVGRIAAFVESNPLLNEKCSLNTMSNNKLLLALNDVINGLSSFALFAAPTTEVLPFLVGSKVVSSGISAMNKINDEGTLSMTVPEHRKAVLQNTCQFMKIAAKENLMLLAQSGKMNIVTNQLEKKKEYYSKSLTNLTKLKNTLKQTTQAIEEQLNQDKNELAKLNEQLNGNDEDLFVCLTINQQIKNASDGKSFPTSAILNLEKIVSEVDPSYRNYAETYKNYHFASIKRIEKIDDTERKARPCAEAGRSWIKAVSQAIDLTSNIVNKAKANFDKKLSTHSDYKLWVDNSVRIQTIDRLENALQELSTNDNAVDRSELSQRLAALKNGLFGPRSWQPSWKRGKPPVLAWINHAKSDHDSLIKLFEQELEGIHKRSYSLTEAGRSRTIMDKIMITPDLKDESLRKAKFLDNLNLNVLKKGSKIHEETCLSLDSAASAYNKALDSLDSIRLFCELIDPALDATVDSDIVKACRGNIEANGHVNEESLVNATYAKLNTMGYSTKIALINHRQKDLGCVMFKQR